jgi:hypothetical protein
MLSIAVLLRGRPDQLDLVIEGFQLGKVLLRLVKLGLKRFIFRCNARQSHFKQLLLFFVFQSDAMVERLFLLFSL